MMMQERYLFRGKTIRGDWVQGLLATKDDKWYISNKAGAPFAYEIRPESICRCTGLHDKNDKLIWEKDIVDGHIKRGAAFLNCLVLWNECKARFDVRAIDCNFPMTLDEVVDDISSCGLDYEVIGNKFDNPELLEV